MVQKNDDFKDLEATLRRALASEKQTGLSANQLNSLHNLIDQGSKSPKRSTSRWWQLSFAGSILATAVVAFVVVERFPNEEQGPSTETSQAWQTSDVETDTKIVTKKVVTEGTAPKKNQEQRKKSPKTLDESSVNLSKLKSSDSGQKTPPDSKPPAIANKVPSAKPAPATVAPAAVASGPQPAKPKQETWESGSNSEKKIGRASHSKADASKSKTSDTTGYGLSGTPSTDDSKGSIGGFGSAGKAPSLQDSQFKQQEQKNAVITVTTTDNSGEVKTFVRSHLNQIRKCFVGLEKSGNGGKISVTWSISKTGRAEKTTIASDNLGKAELRNCIVNTVNRWRFPKENISKVELIYQLK